MVANGEVRAVEQWFVRRGVPHFIEDYSADTDIWTRAVPLLIAAYALGGLRALDISAWSLGRNLLAAALVVAVLSTGWFVTNLVRGRRLTRSPDEIGTPELIAFVVGPSVPSLIFTQYGDAIAAFLTGLGVLAAIYLGTSYAVVPMLMWALRRGKAQLLLIAGLIVRALPLLLLFTTFLFVNADVWAVAGPLDGPAYWLTLSIFFGLGVLFVLSRVPPLMRHLAEFTDWDEVRRLVADTPAAALEVPTAGVPEPRPLGLRERLNIGLLMLFGQALQITLVVVLLTAFFVLFGFLAMSEQTTSAWTGLDDVRVFAHVHLGDRTLVLSEPLLRIAGFLGAFSGMYFTVVLATDATYRDEFAEDVRPEIHRLLAVRLAYGWARRRYSSS